MNNKIYYSLIILLGIILSQECAYLKPIKSNTGGFIYLYDLNKFMYVEHHDLCSEVISGEYFIFKNKITFQCDSNYKFSYLFSKSNSLDSFIIIDRSSNVCFPICPDIDFYNDNNNKKIYSYVFLEQLNGKPIKYAKKDVNKMVVKKLLNSKEHLFPLPIISDTLFINIEHSYFNYFNNKTYSIKKNKDMELVMLSSEIKAIIKKKYPPIIEKGIPITH